MERTSRKRFLFLLAAALGMLAVIAAGCGKTQNNDQSAQSVVVASTSWTALIAKAAGAQEVAVLAPVELRHPPEYDFRPSDIDKVKNAKWIISAGYEPFMKKLLETANIDGENHIQVVTENTPATLKNQTRELAAAMGTTDAQAAWEAEFDQVTADILLEAERMQFSRKKAIVQKHMVPMAKFFGFDVIAEFAEDLSPARTAELAALQPDLIIDNYHNSQGKAIAEMADVERVELRNFPGPEHSAIQDLLKDNARALGLYSD